MEKGRTLLRWAGILTAVAMALPNPQREADVETEQTGIRYVLPISWIDRLEKGPDCLDIFIGDIHEINSILKFSFQWPRPFWMTPAVTNLAEGTSFGFPSGHAQNAAGIWGLVAVSVQKKWILWSALAAILLIGLSRIVLGVHFTHDVLVGWLIGGLLLWLFLKLEKPVINWFKRNSLGIQILALVVITTLLILPAVLLVPPFNPPPVNPEWIEGAGEAIQPYSYDGLLTTSGSFLGLGLGVILLNKAGKFSHEGKVWQLILRYLVGIIGVLLLYMGLGSIFPDDISLVSYALRFFRYFLVGIWISYGAPKVFSWLKLTQG